MNQKGFTNILIILGVVIVGALGYVVFTKNQGSAVQVDEAATWKTYRNVAYGFELKYPPEITLTENQGESGVVVVFEKPDFQLTFFAGMKPVGGYIGYGQVWEKKISIDGKMVDEMLIQCDGDDVMLQIDTNSNLQDRFDKFTSNCFNKSLADIAVPQMEAIAKTLKYL